MKWVVAATFANGEPSAIKSDCGRFHVSKAFVDGCTIYTAWDKNEAIKYSEDREDCMGACAKLQTFPPPGG